MKLNTDIFYWFYGLAHQSSTVDGLIVFCAVYLGYALLICLGLCVLISKDKKTDLRKASVAIGSGLAAWVVAEVLKATLLSPRPFLFLSGVTPLFLETNSAFPSGHASFFGGLAFSLLFSKFPRANIFMIGAVIVGITRVMGGVHWPGDIVGGLTLGFISAYCGNILSRRFLPINNQSNE